MAGAGYKLFNTGDVLTAAQVNTYLQEQAVMRFANSTARTTALSGVLAEGMMSYLDDTNSVEVYNGSAWVSVGSTGDITEVLAGTGISGGGTSGSVTITNSMATAIDAKGDLIVGTGADTFSRLAVGTNGHTLVADSGETTGLKWAAPSSGMTLVKRATFSNVADTGTTFDSVFTSTYENYMLIIGVYGTSGESLYFRLRGSATTRTTGYYALSQAWNFLGTADQITQDNQARFIPYRLSNATTPVPIMTAYINGVGQGTSEQAQIVGTFMGVANTRGGLSFCNHSSASVNDGFILSASTGNIYGTAAVYGLAK